MTGSTSTHWGKHRVRMSSNCCDLAGVDKMFLPDTFGVATFTQIRPGTYFIVSIATLGTLRCLAQEVVTEGEVSTPAQPDIDRGIETEIVGPFRTWHIIFISLLFFVTIIVVICWCHPVRVPRTRQEIEENYKKRVLNRDYLRLLERDPDRAIKRTPGISTTESSRHVRPVRPPKAPTATRVAATGPPRAAKPNVSRLREVEEDEDGDRELKPYRPVAAAKAARLGAPTPLALNPRDLLALVARRRQDGDQ